MYAGSTLPLLLKSVSEETEMVFTREPVLARSTASLVLTIPMRFLATLTSLLISQSKASAKSSMRLFSCWSRTVTLVLLRFP